MYVCRYVLKNCTIKISNVRTSPISVHKWEDNCYKNDLYVSFLNHIHKWRFFLGSKSEILLREPKLFTYNLSVRIRTSVIIGLISRWMLRQALRGDTYG